MNTVTKNTVNGMMAEVENKKRTLKAIAKECRIYEEQSEDDESKAIFARFSDCKTRNEFEAVFKSLN